MKLKTNSKDLLSALKQCSGAMSSNTILPILKNVKIDVEKSVLRIVATNGNSISIVHEIPSENEEVFSFLIDYSDLVNICSNVSGELEIIVDKKQTTVKAGRDVFKVGISDDVKYYIAIPEVKNRNGIDVSGEFFWSLDMASKFTAVGEMDHLNNIFIDFNNGNCTIFATDRVKCFTRTIELAAPNSQYKILPEFVRLIKGFQESEMFFDEKFICIKHNRTTVFIQLSDEKDIPIKGFIDQANKVFNCKVNRKEFLAAISKMMVYDDPFKSYETDLIFANDVINMAFSDTTVNKEVKAEVGAEVDIKDAVILNGKSIKTIVESFSDETEVLNIAIDGAKPVCFGSDNEPIISFMSQIIRNKNI